MFAPYLRVLSTPGALQFSVAGFVARMPISMVTLGIVLLVAERTDSYGLAGAISASYLVATAAVATLLARGIDRWGQSRVLPPAVAGFVTGMALMSAAVELDWPLPLPHVFAAMAGMCFPQIGSCARARWAHALQGDERLNTAYSLESVVDEMIFITGPVLVTMLSTAVHPTAGIVAVIAFAAVGVGWFSSLRATEPPARGRHSDDAPKPALDRGLLLPLVVASLFLGSLFGSTEVVTVAFAREQGQPRDAGLLLATWAAGSLIAGLVTGAVTWRASLLTRYRLGAVGMGCVMLPLPFVSQLALLAVALFVAGFAISPTIIAVMSLVEAGVPASRLTEGITWIITGLSVGIALGAALAGRLIDEYGASPAYYVPLVSGATAALVACLSQSPQSTRTESPEPGEVGRR